MVLKITWETELKDKNGKVIEQKKGVSKSLLTNFMKWLRGLFECAHALGALHPTDIGMNDMDDVGRTIFSSSTSNTTIVKSGAGVAGMNAPAENDDYGLLVGSEETAVEPDDVMLATKIGQGEESGQLSYGAHVIEAIDVVDAVSSFRVSRPWTNLSGAGITVKEIGMAMSIFHGAGTAPAYFLMLRDVLPSPTTIPDGATYTVRYKLSVTA